MIFGRCERCGATQKEAPLTESHSPQKAVLQICGTRGWKKNMMVYCLCRACHDRYTELEKQILRKACDMMMQAHEEYINQPEER